MSSRCLSKIQVFWQRGLVIAKPCPVWPCSRAVIPIGILDSSDVCGDNVGIGGDVENLVKSRLWYSGARRFRWRAVWCSGPRPDLSRFP